MNPHYPLIARRAEHRCEYCHAPEIAFNIPFEVEHVEPAARGGVTEEVNLALACRSCNLFKWSHRDALDPVTKEVERLFNPRLDHWDQHFIVDGQMIRGTTAIGRATVDRLAMNSPQQLRARLRWRMLRLFP